MNEDTVIYKTASGNILLNLHTSLNIEKSSQETWKFTKTNSFNTTIASTKQKLL